MAAKSNPFPEQGVRGPRVNAFVSAAELTDLGRRAACLQAPHVTSTAWHVTHMLSQYCSPHTIRHLRTAYASSVPLTTLRL
eukprot:3231121-Rhodomonas_salina.2